MDINSLIFESMISEASDKVSSLTRRGVALDEAISTIASDLELTTEEVTALGERAKKTSKKVGDEPVAESDDVIIDTNPEDAQMGGHRLHFGSEDDLDQATGMLMYKGIPWKSKSKDGGQFLVEFDDESTLKEAQAVLKRRFDFVEAAPRRVGVVEFDNLADYSKVLEFMKRQGMMLECREGITLDEDAEIQEAVSIELNGIAPSTARSYSARPKAGSPLAEMDVFQDQAARSVIVRKRWK